MATLRPNLSRDGLGISRDTNSIDHCDITEEPRDPLPPAHRAVGLLNSFGVPSFSPWPIQNIIFDMQEFYPSDRINHSKIAYTYMRAVKEAVQRGILIALHQQLEDGLIPIEWRKLRTSCGRYGSRGSEKYWFDWFQTNYPLLEKIKEGYKIGTKGTLTMARTTIDIEILLAGQNPKDIYESLYGSLDNTSDIDYCPIDPISLANYISANKAIAKRNDTLDQNLKSAQTILLISQAPQCPGQLPQIVSESLFGRKYYKGINLQSASKIVRHAALGECHQYDIEASVFTWKFDFVKERYDIKLPATLDYLDFKNHHRLRLTQLIFQTKEKGYVNYIKQAITAIGFGARATNAVWLSENGQWKRTALREIIKSPVLLNQFLNDTWVKEFISEQDAMNKLIWEEIRELPFVKDDVNLRNANNQISKNKAIAKAYQTTERALLRALIKSADSSGVLLTCHDGFYTRSKAKLAELKECLKQYFPNGKLDYEFHTKYKFIDLTFEQQHQKLIEQEEAQAQEQFPENYVRGKDEQAKLKKRYSKRYFDETRDYYDGSVDPEEYMFMPIYDEDEE